MSAIKIDSSNATEVETHRWCIDASTLGLGPGVEYPQHLLTTLGNGQPFVFDDFDRSGTAVYQQAMGCLTLKVFND